MPPASAPDLYLEKVISKPKPLSSFTRTLNDSGMEGVGMLSPFTMAS